MSVYTRMRNLLPSFALLYSCTSVCEWCLLSLLQRIEWYTSLVDKRYRLLLFYAIFYGSISTAVDCILLLLLLYTCRRIVLNVMCIYINGQFIKYIEWTCRFIYLYWKFIHCIPFTSTKCGRGRSNSYEFESLIYSVLIFPFVSCEKNNFFLFHAHIWNVTERKHIIYCFFFGFISHRRCRTPTSLHSYAVHTISSSLLFKVFCFCSSSMHSKSMHDVWFSLRIVSNKNRKEWNSLVVDDF